jgi:hypothetical protein
MYLALFPWVMQHKHKNKLFVFHCQLKYHKMPRQAQTLLQAFVQKYFTNSPLGFASLVDAAQTQKIPFVLHHPLKSTEKRRHD